jgi:hypothetical protein
MDTITYHNLVNYLTNYKFPLNFSNEQLRQLAKSVVNYLVKNNILYRKNQYNLNIPL